MKLATRKNGTRDGELLIVSRDLQQAVSAGADIAPTMQALLDDWGNLAPRAQAAYDDLCAGRRADAFDFDAGAMHSPLPRAYAWIDGSAYINHIILVRKARGAEPPPGLETDPLVYQGGSDTFLGPLDPIPVADLDAGVDFEAEIAVVTGDVPMGTRAADAEQHIRLVMLCNDVSLRNLIPGELKKSFGFFISKPSSAFSPVAVTPDELGDRWRGGRLHRPLRSWLNGERFGDPEAGPEMHFSFHQLIEHCTRTRAFGAGTVLGSGTVSNKDRSRGSSCLAERRMLEIIDHGKATTPFMKYGDRVRIEMTDDAGDSIFGAIDQTVTPAG